MTKRERIWVFGVGLVLLGIFTFTDLQISMVLFTKNLYGRVFEVVGELPFVFLSLFGTMLLLRFRNRQRLVSNLGVGALAIFFAANFTFMGGFMTWNYLCDNLGDVPKVVAVAIGVALLAGAILLARTVPQEHAHKAVTYAIIAIVYFIAVIIIMNIIKGAWGRMRIREMTDPLTQFTPWYVLTNRGGFDNAYASFPSGHSMNSAAIILAILLPPILPLLAGKEKLLKGIAYGWMLVVGSSRVVMGAHFASDVTVGLMLSLVIFELTRFVVFKVRHERNFTHA